MQTLRVRNVTEAFAAGMSIVPKMCYMEGSRNGPVLVAPGPVTTMYERPQERVLFCARRDANPFFHLMESVWMLAGEQDARWLDRYVGNFSSRFAEDNGLQHGAYGHRWRRHFQDMGRIDWTAEDQLVRIGEILREKPDTRQAVMAMWSPLSDLGVIKRDIPCNTHIYFRTRPAVSSDPDQRRWLDYTVCCRSNDIVWGAYGANAVHMSILGELVAGLADMRMGVYYQMSNNWHVYMDIYAKIMQIEPSSDGSPVDVPRLHDDNRYATGEIQRMVPVATSQTEAENVLLDAASFVRGRDGLEQGRWRNFVCRTPFFEQVVVPMQMAYDFWKDGQRDKAIQTMAGVQADDWRIAGREWMRRRQVAAQRSAS